MADPSAPSMYRREPIVTGPSSPGTAREATTARASIEDDARTL
jgi:hypothetical protein